MNSSQESFTSYSQETLAPLSQETLAKTLNAIPKEIFDSFMKNNFDANLSSMEDYVEDFHESPNQFGAVMTPLQMSNIEGSHEQSSIPALENVPGCFDFTVSTIPEDSSKKCKYTYSSVSQKLYVKKDVSCPFTFSTNEPLEGFVIRAMLYYSSPENRSKVVERCHNHVKIDQEKGDEFHMHFVRSLSKSANYFEDPGSKRTSVTVNYENPGIGERSSTYLFKFMCFTSCVGGPNRRPMSIVFTLEKGGIQTFGRCKIDLKVCSDPSRDKVAEESNLKGKNYPSLALNTSSQSLNNILQKEENVLNQFKMRRVKVIDDKNSLYLKARDKEEYNFLRTMQRYYCMNKLVNTYKWTPTATGMHQVLRVLSSTSYEESE